MPVTTRFSDAAILEKIRNNDLKGWEALYDVYSAAMLGIIFKLTNDKEKGQQVLIKIFTDHAFSLFLHKIHASLPGRLYVYTFINTIAILKSEGIGIDAGMIEGLPGIYKLLYKKEEASMTAITVPAVSKVHNWLPAYGFNIYADMISYS